MANVIDSQKEEIKKIFEKWYRVPEYQRPYVWGSDEVLDLLDDISFACMNDNKSEYFLGSIIFQTKDDEKSVDLLDGQQRLTTLFLITAVVRDLTENEKLKIVTQKIIFQEENEFDDIPEKIRITFDIREELKNFIDEYIKNEGNLTKEKLEHKLKTTDDISIKNMINAIFTIQDYFKRNDTISVEEFFKYLNKKVVMIYVSSSSLEDAFRLFTIMNDRGIKLRNSDILKAENLKQVEKSLRKEYAKKWEEIENYFEEDFDKFLSHLRTILVKEKARKNLLDEFEENIYFKKGAKKGNRPLLKQGKDTFEFIKKYQENYDWLFNKEHSNNFDNLLNIMKTTLPADYWVAPLLKFYDKFLDNRILEFLEKLDNKFSYDWIVGLSPTTRIENVNKILKKIEEIDDVELLLKDEIFKIDINQLINVLNEDIYGKRFAKYILFKLDYLYADDKINVPNIISVEHILPQNPDKNSQWVKDFTKDEREELTHKIGNLILLSRRKNSSQGRKDFKYKKEKYFKDKINLFPNSIRVMNSYSQWTPKEIKENQKEVINKLKNHYKKNS